MVSTALGDDSQAVVLEVSEAIRSALDELHLAVEAFGDSVVARKPPHAGDRFLPVLQGIGQGLQWDSRVFPQGSDRRQQGPDVLFAVLFGLVLVVHELAELVHLLVEVLEDGMGGEELLEA